MPKISSVEPQKKHPLRFNIYLDGQFAFGANEDLVVEYRLIVGKEISKQDLEKLMFEAEVGKLMERMYHLFSIRQRSEKEVRDYLKIKNQKSKVKNDEGISDLVIEFLIKKLKDKGLINDYEFTKAWVNSRRRSRQKGALALKAELFKKGIDKEVINEVLASFKNEDEEEVAQQALQKRLKRFKNLPYLDKKKKALEYLARGGFEYTVAKRVVEKILEKE